MYADASDVGIFVDLDASVRLVIFGGDDRQPPENRSCPHRSSTLATKPRWARRCSTTAPPSACGRRGRIAFTSSPTSWRRVCLAGRRRTTNCSFAERTAPGRASCRASRRGHPIGSGSSATTAPASSAIRTRASSAPILPFRTATASRAAPLPMRGAATVFIRRHSMISSSISSTSAPSGLWTRVGTTFVSRAGVAFSTSSEESTICATSA